MNSPEKKGTVSLPTMQIPMQHVVQTTPQVLESLATSLADFTNIAPELAVLTASGGARYSVVTDGTHAVVLNAEGYAYPRYRGPRMLLALLEKITPADADALCVRKSTWPAGFSIETAEQLAQVAANPYRHTA